jgi:hypothetical protein
VLGSSESGKRSDLQFGGALPAGDTRQVNARLQEYLDSPTCRRFTGIEGVSLTL